MVGTYQTIDGCQYRVFMGKTGKPPKSQLMGQCIKSTVREGPFDEFPIVDGQIEKNTRHHYWIKLE